MTRKVLQNFINYPFYSLFPSIPVKFVYLGMPIGSEIKSLLYPEGLDIIEFVDILHLSLDQNRGFSSAILIGILLSPAYLKKVRDTVDYVEMINRNRLIEEDEFHRMELKTDGLADLLMDYLLSKGYSAYSQSESNLDITGSYDAADRSTPLPHKTIARIAGLGWIGKNNLLVSNLFGSAISMCTVLTNAPLETVRRSPMSSDCGDCDICKNICGPKALRGKAWESAISRDEILDANLCTSCLRCMVLCPMTQAYLRSKEM